MNLTTHAAHVLGHWPPEGLERVSACPCCSSADRRIEIEDLQDRIFGSAPGKWTLFRCLHCGCAYLDPRPNRRTIGLAYSNYYTHAPVKQRSTAHFMSWLRVGIANSYRNRVFATNFSPSVPGGWMLAALARTQAHALRLEGRGLDRVIGIKGKLLDIGCGNGDFLGLARQAGWECYGVEPDEGAALVAAAQNAKIIGSQVDQLRGRFERCFEIITLNHVIEHVHDPAQMFRDCWEMLKPGGFLWLETPNIDSVGYEIFSRAWRGLEPPRHLVLFNRKALIACMNNAGFTDVRVLAPRDDALRYTFSRSAYINAGSFAEVDPAPLSKADELDLQSNLRKARKLVRVDPARSEVIDVVAYKS